MSPTASDSISFSGLGLSDDISSIVKELGYEVPTPVQAQSIPILLAGKDMIGQAQTGTGKTAAFALPLLSKIDLKKSATQVLVLTPTRELAIQVAEAFHSYARRCKGFHVLPVYGGQPMGTQFRQLERRPHVIVGTPGRVMDHLRRKTLVLDSLTALVMDEADEMLSMGFLEDIQWIIEQAPAEKQTVLFSATMPKAIRSIAQKYLKNPQEVVIEQVASSAALISQSYWVVSGLHKLDALTRILEVSDIDGVLIFMRTKTATVELAEKLEARGYSAGALNGDMNQVLRDRTVQSFKQGRLDVLVATDVAARGLDIDRVSHVINYDVPFDLQTYTHRIGRTGRAGRAGTAILFVSPREMGLLRVMERGTGKKIPALKMPTREDLANKRIEKLVVKIEGALKDKNLERYGDVINLIMEKTQAGLDTVAQALCTLLHQASPLFSDSPDVVAESVERNDSRPERPHWKKRTSGHSGGHRKGPRQDRAKEGNGAATEGTERGGRRPWKKKGPPRRKRE